MAEVTIIEIEVGKLPEWYLEDEGNHDISLEWAIEERWHSNPAYTDAEIQVSYNYNTEFAIIKAYDDNGNLIFERNNHDFGYALEYAKKLSYVI